MWYPNWKPSKMQETVTESTTAVCSSSTESCRSGAVYLQTFRAWVSFNDDCVYVRGLFDSGSQITFIREDVAKKLKLPSTGEIEVTINTFASTSSSPVRRRLVQVKLRSQYQAEDIVIDAIVVPVICKDILENPISDEHLTRLEDNDMDMADAVLFPGVPKVLGISVLIGGDQIWQFLTGEIKRSRTNEGLVAMNSKLGWTFLGPSTVRGLVARQTKGMICVLRASPKPELGLLSDDSKRFWELEKIGITDDVQTPQYKAKTILKKLVVSLSRNKGLLQDYDQAIRCYIRDGHAEEVPRKEDVGYPVVKSEPIYYMPHPEVIKEQSTSTRLRIVFGRFISCSWSQTAEIMAQSFYVDDLVFGADSTIETQRLYYEAGNTLNQAKMELRKWSSNPSELQERFRRDGVDTPGAPAVSKVKVLGITWDTNDDSLSVVIEALITAEELDKAQVDGLKVAQESALGQEISLLERNESISSSSRLRQLHPFLDDDLLLRLQGRLQEADLDEDKKHPIILPHDHRIVELVAMGIHQRLLHSGVNAEKSHRDPSSTGDTQREERKLSLLPPPTSRWSSPALLWR
ncbi:uncharacterized protein LOC135376442 [Ornithodoros turicata]|uniref:uncharacterized protein LOC135376442 n=1 Tax=Ornithodoros turicata TaxID=34597 RepID=UPI0031398BB1